MTGRKPAGGRTGAAPAGRIPEAAVRQGSCGEMDQNVWQPRNGAGIGGHLWKTFFEGFDFTDFWDDSDYAEKEYIEAAPSDELIAGVEQELGYRLPASLAEKPEEGRDCL